MIFVDSCYFIALMNEKDKWHERALEISNHLKNIVVSDFVISESITMVGYLADGKIARQLFEFFIDNCKIVYVDDILLKSAMQNFVKFNGKLSLADCVSLEIMKNLKIEKIVSFDDDFDKANVERVY